MLAIEAGLLMLLDDQMFTAENLATPESEYVGSAHPPAHLRLSERVIGERPPGRGRG